MPKLLTVWITTNCGKFLKRWEFQTTFPASWEICMQAKKQQWELDTEQLTGSKLGKEYFKAVYCHLAHLTYMQSTSCEMPGWMKPKLESRFPGEISITTGDITLMAESKEKLKSLLMKVREESKNSWLKTQHSKNKDHGIWSHHFTANRGKQWKQWQTLFLGAPKSLQMVTAAMNLKDTCSFEEKLWPT